MIKEKLKFNYGERGWDVEIGFDKLMRKYTVNINGQPVSDMPKFDSKDEQKAA